MEDNKFDQLLEELDKDSQYFHKNTCSAVFTNKDGARSDTITDSITFRDSDTGARMDLNIGDAAYIGAIAVGGMLFNIIYWMFAFLRMGTSGMTAQARGRRDFDEVVKLLVRSVGLALGISLVLLVLSPIIQDIALNIIAPGAEVEHLASLYFNICIWGAPASLGLFALNGWFIGMQNSKTPMAIAISQNILNIVASLFLVFGLGMKIEGIALGTAIAQWGGFGAAVVLLLKYYARLWKQGWPQSIWNVAAILQFFNVNKDIFLRTLCLIFVHFFFIAAGAKQGDTELAVNTLLMQFFTLYSYFMDGFAFAGEALAGKAVGAQNLRIYHSVVKHLFGWGVAMASGTASTLEPPPHIICY